jgi:hypothetical protein
MRTMNDMSADEFNRLTFFCKCGAPYFFDEMASMSVACINGCKHYWPTTPYDPSRAAEYRSIAHAMTYSQMQEG